MSQLFSTASAKMQKSAKWFMSICVGFALISCLGCSAREHGSSRTLGSPLTTSQIKGFKAKQLQRVVVVPFETTETLQLSDSALAAQTKELVNAFERETSLDVVNGSDPDTFSHVWDKTDRVQEALRRKAAVVGKKVGADSALYGVITKFYNRPEKARYGATAAFQLWLIDPRTEQVLWSATYEDREQPLSENLLRLGEKLETGFGFKTAEDLLKQGFTKAARDLEKSRR